jgi:CheY-like chemotaxis protein
VTVAGDGVAGVARARAGGFDAVLCDLGLPGLDGYGVARALRADPATRRLLLVAISGYAQAEDRERARAAGFDAHVAKPPRLEELERLLAGAGPSGATAAG